MGQKMVIRELRKVYHEVVNKETNRKKSKQARNYPFRVSVIVASLESLQIADSENKHNTSVSR